MQQFIGLFFSIFLLLVGHVTPAYAADTPPPEKPVSQDSFDDYKELADIKLEAAKESLQKDIQNFVTRAEGQDKRIDQLNSEIDHSLALLGVLLVLAGVISFFSFRNAARKQALDEVKAWFAEHEQSLNNRKQDLTDKMDGFNQQILELQKQVHDQAEKIREMMKELEDRLLAESDELVKKISASRQVHDSLKANMPQLSQSEAELLAKAAYKTQYTPEAARTFADWNRLAFAANNDNKKEQAISYWQKAVNTSDVTDTEIAKSLFNMGVTWGELEQYQKEIDVYDNLLHRYGSSQVDDVNEQCAKALFNKGVVLEQNFNDTASAMVVYDHLLHSYGFSKAPGIQEQHARALYNKGWILENKLDDAAGAIAMYDSLLSSYCDLNISSIWELCSKALFNKGVLLTEKLNDAAGAVAAYDALLHRYGESTVPSIQKQCATALVNKGAIQGGKLNDTVGALATNDTVLCRYGDSTVPDVQEECAKALFNKCLTLHRDSQMTDSVACYDNLLARYGSSDNSEIQEQCLKAQLNTVEILLVEGSNTEAVQRIRQVLRRRDTTNQVYAIMPFLLWLANTNTTPPDVLAAIRALCSEVQFTWVGDDIRPLVDKLPEPRKTQAECFITFFEKHHDIAMLEQCLAAASN